MSNSSIQEFLYTIVHFELIKDFVKYLNKEEYSEENECDEENDYIRYCSIDFQRQEYGIFIRYFKKYNILTFGLSMKGSSHTEFKIFRFSPLQNAYVYQNLTETITVWMFLKNVS